MGGVWGQIPPNPHPHHQFKNEQIPHQKPVLSSESLHQTFKQQNESIFKGILKLVCLRHVFLQELTIHDHES